MYELLAGFAFALPVIGILIWQVQILRAALASERQRCLELVDRLSSRDYEHFAAVKRFVEPWNEDDLHPESNDGVAVLVDPTGMFEAESPPIP